VQTWKTKSKLECEALVLLIRKRTKEFESTLPQVALYDSGSATDIFKEKL